MKKPNLLIDPAVNLTADADRSFRSVRVQTETTLSASDTNHTSVQLAVG